MQEYLEEHVNLKVWDKTVPITREQLFKELEDVEGFITSGVKVNEELLRQAPKLRVVSTISVGYNHFDLEAMNTYGVIGTHTPYVLDDTVADLVISLMLSAARRIPELDAMTKRGDWKKGNAEQSFGVDVHHQKLGIIGMGRIGEKIAQRALFGFDMEVSYFNRNRKYEVEKKLNIKALPMDDLLKESDFIVLLVPLTSETKQLIGEREFILMKKSAIFINASRGQTVDEQALINALKTNEILAAGLDVYEQEPIDPNNPLLKMENVVTLPHIGSATLKTRNAMAMVAAKNIVAALLGEGSFYQVK
ncbi:D-glycerate dehydrogenase [Anaerobacillus sp. CMMVII]|uniref:2-hydroxyacid dehydrogenase n=1 Tax=Anaerobacillus sp. CMMVII TaxID=2755588 RepID=UPI0021B7666F|nr:D-glycerate dehydrogenase [Anaerobacillus sp. CMMVII]MCT8139175.1 D-glycerate dehydrogenase [Anaerobacillus sp. CMMVII]